MDNPIDKALKKKFGHELAKRPKVFREHVLSGLRLGTLKHEKGIIPKTKRERMLNDSDTGVHGNIRKVKGPKSFPRN